MDNHAHIAELPADWMQRRQSAPAGSVVGYPVTGGAMQQSPKQPISARVAEAIKRATELANHAEHIADGIVGTVPVPVSDEQSGELNSRPLTAEIDTLLSVIGRAERNLARISSAL